jgi:hypothetical protein
MFVSLEPRGKLPSGMRRPFPLTQTAIALDSVELPVLDARGTMKGTLNKALVMSAVCAALVVLAGLAIRRAGLPRRPDNSRDAEGPENARRAEPRGPAAATACRHTESPSAETIRPTVPGTEKSSSAGNAPATLVPVDPRTGIIADRAKPDRTRLETLVAFNRSGETLAFKTDLDLLARTLRDTAEGDTLRHEIANLLLSHKYPGLTDILIGILDSPGEQERFRAFCVQHLWRRAGEAPTDERNRIADLLRESLNDRHTAVRREALLALVRDNDELGRSAAGQWLTDPKATAVRDLAIRCVREMNLRDYTDAIRASLEDTNEVVRIAAIVTLGEWGDDASRSSFQRAASSDSERLRRAGRRALEELDSTAGK